VVSTTARHAAAPTIPIAALPGLQTDQRKSALISAWLGQAFDAMNTMMFFIIMYPALSDLLHTKNETSVGWYSGIIIAIFTIGWALGSVVFGMLAEG
jgi:MFS family permease